MELFAMRITATGEVRDADGNLTSTVPIESVIEVTEDELRQMMETK